MKNIQASNYEIYDTYCIGIDVHKPSWKLAIRFNGQELRRVSMDPSAEQLRRFVDRHYGQGRFVTVYEAGFTGFSTHRALVGQQFENLVIHPADVPTTDKEKRRKTDKVDCRKLARFLEEYCRNPDPYTESRITPVWVPPAGAEALRDVFRLRDQLVNEQTRMKNRIWSFLDKWGMTVPAADELPRWSRRFVAYLHALEFDQPAARLVLDQHLERLATLGRQLLQVNRLLREQCKAHGIWEVIEALRSRFRGVGWITAIGYCCELMDIHRFANGDRLSSYLGLVPDVHGSGDYEQYKGVTSRCNQRLRRLLIEAAWVAARQDEELHSCWRGYIRRMSKQKAIIRIARKLALRMRKVWIEMDPFPPNTQRQLHKTNNHVL